MLTSHVVPSPSTGNLRAALKAIEEKVAGLHACDPGKVDMLALEEELRAVFAAAEREAIALALAHVDVDVPEVMISGIRHKRVLRCEAPYMTSAGEVRIERTLGHREDKPSQRWTFVEV